MPAGDEQCCNEIWPNLFPEIIDKIVSFIADQNVVRLLCKKYSSAKPRYWDDRMARIYAIIFPRGPSKNIPINAWHMADLAWPPRPNIKITWQLTNHSAAPLFIKRLFMREPQTCDETKFMLKIYHWHMRRKRAPKDIGKADFGMYFGNGLMLEQFKQSAYFNVYYLQEIDDIETSQHYTECMMQMLILHPSQFMELRMGGTPYLVSFSCEICRCEITYENEWKCVCRHDCFGKCHVWLDKCVEIICNTMQHMMRRDQTLRVLTPGHLALMKSRACSAGEHGDLVKCDECMRNAFLRGIIRRIFANISADPDIFHEIKLDFLVEYHLMMRPPDRRFGGIMIN